MSSLQSRRHTLGVVFSMGAASFAPIDTARAETDYEKDRLATVVVTGSRTETTALKALAPVQLIKGEALRSTGASDLRRALSLVAPSYININSNGGALSKNVGGSSLRDRKSVV